MNRPTTVLLFLLLFDTSFSQQRSTQVFWQSWDLLDISDEGNSAPGSIQLLQGFTGTTKGALEKSSDGTTKDGDLIELGYFDIGTDSANTDATNLFRGTWTPLTSTTTIGLYPTNAASNSVDGLFYLSTKFTQNAGDGSNEDAKSLLGTTRTFTDDLGSALNSDIGALDSATSGSTYARLGIRFYDVSQSADTGGTSKANGTARYNTVMAESWRWADTTTVGALIEMNLHNPTNQAATSGLVFEFDNSDGNTLGSKYGTSDTAVGTDDYVASITYHDGSSNLDLDTLGSTILSGLNGSGDLMGGDNGDSLLTIHSSAGNTAASSLAYEFTGNIYESSSAHSDLSIIKTGGGDQILSGNINLAASSGDEGFVNLLEGGLTLNPGSGETQVIEYLKGASGTTLTLDNTGAGTLELGFAETHASSESTFAGNVALTGSGASNIIKVSSGSDSGDYSNEQVISGIISGSEKLTKSGKGRLKLSGVNTFNGGVDIEDGTLVVGNNAGAGTGTVTINKGKLEVSSSVNNMTNTIQGGSGKSLIGGDGTVASITIGSGANEIDYLSPGQGISSSLSPSQEQMGFGNGAADDAIGSFTATTLSLQGGGVFDWELQDFDGTTGGTDYDVMNFTNLSFGAKNETFTINILGLQSSDGAAGAPNNYGTTSRVGTNGFKFLNNNNSSGITWTGGAEWTSAELNDYFVFNTN
ncbi:MAG: autotransporter-associated beta strand repeat-containing protein, partial [Opitutales bacterium]|nr:autotransporter-associated beta strand repeat-containing protein [Opitutales bacterium]